MCNKSVMSRSCNQARFQHKTFLNWTCKCLYLPLPRTTGYPVPCPCSMSPYSTLKPETVSKAAGGHIGHRESQRLVTQDSLIHAFKTISDAALRWLSQPLLTYTIHKWWWSQNSYQRWCGSLDGKATSLLGLWDNWLRDSLQAEIITNEKKTLSLAQSWRKRKQI